MTLLAMHNVLYTWDDSNSPLLDCEEFHADAGSKILIRGPSGSGKSTLLNLIGGVLVPQKGSISILGTEIQRLSNSERDRFRADHMGFIFQMFNLLPYLNVLENVLLPLRFSEHKLQKLRKNKVDPKQEAERLLTALGLDAKLNQRVSTLSVGQQQRVAVARALMGSPELIMADEPSSALDSDTRAAFLELLFRECERSQTTLLYVSHDQGLENYFDRCVPISHFNATSEGVLAL